MNQDEGVIGLKEQWIKLAGKYSNEAGLVLRLFAEIEAAYGSSDRHYHNLLHIDALLQFSNQYQDHLHDKETVDFSIFYHDIIYRVERSDNEIESAAIAQNQLRDLGLPEEKISIIVGYINATRLHAPVDSGNEDDLAWFLDFDMSILGAKWEVYLQYSQKVRKEYMIYPDVAYLKGRKKFIQETLNTPFIFNTPEFRSMYEQQARVNMEKELSILNTR